MDANSSTTSLLHTLHLVNRRTGEHTGPCPHCKTCTNRYHIWTWLGAGGCPAWRGRGLGRALLAAGLAQMPKDGKLWM